MRVFTIDKGNGKKRLICAPSSCEEWQAIFRWKSIVNDVQLDLCGPWVHGFMPGRSPVTNALAHVGYEWTLSCDLTDFFDSVNSGHLSPYLPSEAVTEIENGGILYKGAPRQGLPTSPAAANIGAAAFDKAIIDWLSLQDCKTVYTRYADDLTFSWNGPREFAYTLRQNVEQIAAGHGFTINKKKTRLQSARGGRRVICGVSTGETDIRPARPARRKLRAAEHRWNKTWTVKAIAARLSGAKAPSKDLLARKKLEGLREWCKLKLPA